MAQAERRPANAEPPPNTTAKVDARIVAAPTVSRTVFATPRAAEFLEVRALCAQTGQPAEAFGDVVVKELLDNALDGAETAGVAPVIDVATRTDDDEITFVTVSDNGAGIAPEVVGDLCDFTMLVSDKAKYRGPARGAQGNALKTILGIPFALGVDAPVVIESHGVRHELRVTDDHGDVVVAHDTGPSDRAEGTSVTVPLPADLDVEGWRWAFGAALVNPHATIEHTLTTTTTKTPSFYKPAGQPWSKWTPSQPSNPHWYDRAAFTALVYAHIRQTRRTGVDVPLGKFIAEFEGLSGFGEAAEDSHRCAWCDPPVAAGRPRRRDRRTARPSVRPRQTHPGVPAGNGRRRALPACSRRQYGVLRFWFKRTTATVHGVPWIIEVAVADTEEPGGIWYGVNHSPSFGDPLGRAMMHSGDCFAQGATTFLADAGVRDNSNTAAVVHVICAAPQFVDRAKWRWSSRLMRS